MVIQFSVYYIIFILWPMSSLASAQSIVETKPGCDGTCGISIPYPFGMKDPNCYADKWFEIDCRNVSGILKPFLKFADMEVTYFSAAANLIEINNPIKCWNCRNKTTGNAVDLRGSPFVYSQTLNKFYAIGCNSLVLLNSNGTKVGGCVSVCDDNNDEANFETSDGCHGRYCCETSLPNYLKEFNTTVETLGDNPNPNSTVTVSDDQCNCALIVSEGFLFQRPYTYNRLVHDLTFSGYASAYLEWEITDSSLQLPNRNNYCYQTNSTSSNNKSTGRRCRCNDGFGGNPYISGGCTGTKLDYMYVCVFSSLGSILLLLGIWWLYKLAKKRMTEKRKEKNFKENGGLLLQQKLTSGEVNVEKTKLFSLKDLEKATDRFNFTDKSDVYSFGVVLIELLTGQKPISSLRQEEAKSLASYFIICMEEDCLFDIVDDRVMKDGEKEHIMEVAVLAKRCINLNGKKRPTMKEVTIELERIQNLGKRSNLHQNHEEIDFPEIEAYKPWVADPTSMSIENSTSSSSTEILPIVYFK
ncbi:hypothetical protein L6164_033178 [Bauhinia variegata]|uniref:Uncharacterized protein n=1 Tax=Bauhinia variegata TaxID=167791 RepID=A0ACB9KQX4_BAUVA|nr:hypothetical protein L6164_033178 [Bauhinia variegata]